MYIATTDKPWWAFFKSNLGSCLQEQSAVGSNFRRCFFPCSQDFSWHCWDGERERFLQIALLHHSLRCLMLPTEAMVNPCPMEMCEGYPPKKVERGVDEKLLVGAGGEILWEKENGKSFRRDWISGKIPPGEGRGRSIEMNWVMGKAEREKEKSPLAAPGSCHDYHNLFCSETLRSLIYATHSGQIILPLLLNRIFNFFCHFLWRMGVKFGHTTFEF